jgi:hypothetical protein
MEEKKRIKLKIICQVGEKNLKEFKLDAAQKHKKI